MARTVKEQMDKVLGSEALSLEKIGNSIPYAGDRTMQTILRGLWVAVVSLGERIDRLEVGMNTVVRDLDDFRAEYRDRVAALEERIAALESPGWIGGKPIEIPIGANTATVTLSEAPTKPAPRTRKTKPKK